MSKGKLLLNAISAGILIQIGCCVYLACESTYVGAVLFPVALLCICIRGYALFTGRVGNLAKTPTKDETVSLLIVLAGNAIGILFCALAAGYAIPNLAVRAQTICTAKLTQAFGQTIIRAFFCGVLMYLAVTIWKEKQNALGILFCVPVFILSGFEHSIADMGYFVTARMISFSSLWYLIVVILGNAIGAVAIGLLEIGGGISKRS